MQNRVFNIYPLQCCLEEGQPCEHDYVVVAGKSLKRMHSSQMAHDAAFVTTIKSPKQLPLARLQSERIGSMSGDIGQSTPAFDDLGVQIDRTSGTRRWIVLPFHSQATGGRRK